MALRAVISSKLPMVIVLGATGTGKTKLGVELAQKFGGEIISADSMQIYKGLDIVTAKASRQERDAAPHHLLDLLEPHQMFTVVDFRNRSLKIIDNLTEQGKMPIIVGGTHYYIESIVYKILVEAMDDEEALLWDVSRGKRPLEDEDDSNPKRIATEKAIDQASATSSNDETKVKEKQSECISHNDVKVEQEVSKKIIQEIFDNEKNFTNEELHKKLEAIDPETASRHHPNNRRKVLRNHAITPITRLLLTLRYYATGSFLTVVGDFSGVSKASASRIVNLVSQAIARLRSEFIKFPTNTREIQQEFYNIAKFPRLVGAIDCTHVPIKSPVGNNAEDWRNRKSQFSFNVQTVVSAKLKILDIVARWPGAAHDQTIFNNSYIKQRLLSSEFGNCMIVGDKGYENTSYLLIPLQNPITPAEHLYNESQIRSRNVVERTYGVWKNRFPVLSKKVLLHLSRVQAVIVACAVLHNIAIDMRDDHFESFHQADEADDDYLINQGGRENLGNTTVRSNLINDYFASLL